MKIAPKVEINAGIYALDVETEKVTTPTIQGSALVKPEDQNDILYIDDTNDLVFFGRQTHPSIGEAVLGVKKEFYQEWFTEIVEN